MQPAERPLLRSDLLYDLPDEAIAQAAIEPRDSSRLLDTRDMSDHVFRDLADLLEEGDLLVVNETKVRHARLRGTRVGTGGRVEVLVLDPVGDGTWSCLCRPSRRLRSGVRLDFGGLGGEVVSDPVDGRVRLRFDEHNDLEAWFAEVGEVPLPPYFHGALPDVARYQTIFADEVGSAAAPTAALHFTEELLGDLAARGIGLAKVELRVGLDTFRPVEAEYLVDHRMHTESFRVPPSAAAAVAATKERGGRVIAVGTTVTRTLEAAADQWGTVHAMETATDLFITPGYRFRTVDGIITNFHVPGSTLIALVAAALGESWRDVYRAALDRGYRFLSFGDAMFIDVRGAERGEA